MIFRLAKSIAIFLATLVILFEEWLWEPLKRIMQAFSRLPVIRQAAAYISRLSPKAAMVLYLAPMVVLLPFKIMGLWLIANGHMRLGIASFLAAKLLGTALFAWLFSLTKPALMQVGWFAKTYGWVQRLSQAAHDWLHRQALYHVIKAIAKSVRLAAARLFGR